MHVTCILYEQYQYTITCDFDSGFPAKRSRPLSAQKKKSPKSWQAPSDMSVIQQAMQAENEAATRGTGAKSAPLKESPKVMGCVMSVVIGEGCLLYNKLCQPKNESATRGTGAKLLSD